jgi:hypothetical protein
MLGAKELWKASALLKVKLFFWLALHGRIWRADRRKRRGLQDSAECALCSQDHETVDHLLVSCVFVRELWHRLLLSFCWDGFVPALEARLSDWWFDVRRQVPKELRKGSTRRCSSSLGGCGRNVTPGCSTVRLARQCRLGDGYSRKLRSGPLWGSQPFRCCWWPRR